MTSIVQPTSPQELDDARGLMRGFVAWHRERHVEDIAFIDRSFDEAEFEAELAGLPGKYAPPEGRLLLAYVENQAAGCVALRDLGDGICEMKRMFVPTGFGGGESAGLPLKPSAPGRRPQATGACDSTPVSTRMKP